MGMKKQMKKINPEKGVSPLCSSSAGKRSLPEFLPEVYKGDRKGKCLLYFLSGNVLRSIINALVVHCCVSEGSRPRLSMKKMFFALYFMN